jgi:hypothetical protein
MNKSIIAAFIASAVVLASAAQAGAQVRAPHISADRAAAIHQCSVLAGRYPETTWSSLEFEVYGACMARHGQIT